MADFRHMLLVASGGYTGLPEEHWQVSLNFIASHGLVPPDDSGDLPVYPVVHNADVRTEADWTIDSLWHTNSIGDDFNPSDWLNDQVAPAFAAWIAAGGFSVAVRLDSLKVSPISTTGRVVDLRTVVLNWTASNPVGTSSSQILPLQNSIVVSWGTPNIGRRGRGRIFTPPTTVAGLDSSGLVDGTHRTSVAAAAVALLEGCAFDSVASPGWYIRPIVCASAASSYGIITDVNVGSVVDTHRSRRRSIKEVRTHAAPAY